MGSAASRIADAFVSAFLVTVEPPLRDKDPVGLAVARANAEGAELLPTAIRSLDVMLRQHIIAAQRTILGDVVASGQETRPMAVGFVDLVGSTALSERLSTRDLGAALGEFEELASDTVTAVGGRVVKLIGDEILFTAADEPSACRIALDLVAAFSEHPTLPPVRAGLAFGEVILRDGDVFGPVVNLAARAARVAESGAVVAEASAAAGAADAEPLGRYRLKGFEKSVELYRVAAFS
jgi:adenylate cyclase